MKILTIIPARGGSKGVPRKNIQKLGDKPLVAHVIDAALKAKLPTTVAVSTDDEEIATIAKKFGAEVPCLRPANLAGDKASLIAVARHMYEWYTDNGHSFDGVMTLQPTCPFTTPETIDSSITLFTETQCEAVTIVSEIQNGHPYIAKRILEGQAIEPFTPIPPGVPVTPRQAREKAHFLTGALYLRNLELLYSCDENGHCLGDDCRVVEVGEFEAVDINTPLDYKFAQFLASEMAGS